eukprot:5189051-Amphidinium_carterae.1
MSCAGYETLLARICSGDCSYCLLIEDQPLSPRSNGHRIWKRMLTLYARGSSLLEKYSPSQVRCQ